VGFVVDLLQPFPHTFSIQVPLEVQVQVIVFVLLEVQPQQDKIRQSRQEEQQPG